MKTELECLPCFFGQVARALAFAGVNGDRGREIMRKAEALIERASMSDVPARTTTVIHRMVREETGADPYRTVKEAYNRIALELLPALRARVSGTSDALEGAVRAAIAGNIIDFGIYETIELDRSVEEAFSLPLPEAYRSFAAEVGAAHRVLYLCDNAGEIVFDIILIETLRNMGKKVTVAVKGGPVINDATLDDAVAVDLNRSAAVMDNGSDGIGTLLETCSPRFIEEYRRAALVVGKGQANYETLVGEDDGRIFFLFKVKCPVVAAHLNRRNGDLMIARGGETVRRR
jgi:damage-control phosphatase, subfamily I